VGFCFEVGHADQPGLRSRQFAQALPEPDLFCVQLRQRILLNVMLRSLIHDILGMHPYMFTPDPINVQVPRDAIEPGTQPASCGIVTLGAISQLEHRFLGQVFCDNRGRPQRTQVSAKTRHEMVVDPHEALAILASGHAIHFGDPLLQRVAL